MNQNVINITIIILLAVILVFIGINSCNDHRVNEQNNSKLEELINQRLRQSDSLHRVAIDSMLSISARDSAHNVSITNIFNNANENKKQIISSKPDSKRVNYILRWADSIANSNRQPTNNTGW